MTTLVVQKDRVVHNLKTLRQEMGVTVIPVLKGNAYGLGDVQMAKLLVDEGVSIIAVSRLEEAEHLAAELPDTEILLLTPYCTEREAERIIAMSITATVGSYDSAVLLNGIAEKHNVKCRVHFKFDTGMGRFGFLPSEAEKAVQAAKYLKNLEVCGCFTHLSNCFGKDKKGVLSQLEQFKGCIELFTAAGIDPGLTHIANSAGAILYPALRLNAVRVGSALLGRVSVRNKLGLKKVGRLESTVCDLRWLPAGHNIGYANTYKTKKPVRIAVIPVGYADGLFNEKSKDTFRFVDILRYGWQDFKLLFRKPRLTCVIDGKTVHILGRVGLCNVVADVSSVNCDAGDVASFEVNPLFIDSGVERRYE